MKDRVVSYINIDGCVSGDAIDATASVPLKKVIVEALKNVPDPLNPNDYERTYYDFWKEQKQVIGIISKCILNSYQLFCRLVNHMSTIWVTMEITFHLLTKLAYPPWTSNSVIWIQTSPGYTLLVGQDMIH